MLVTVRSGLKPDPCSKMRVAALTRINNEVDLDERRSDGAGAAYGDSRSAAF